MKITPLLLLLLFLRAPLLLAQQSLLQKQVELGKTAGTVQELLQELGQQGNFTFSYGNNIGLQRQVTLQRKSQTVEAHLQELFAWQPVSYLLRENKIILYVPAKGQTNNPVPQKVTVSGYVTDEASGETLIGATVQAPASRSGVASNQYGFYSLTLPAGETTLQVSYIGYQSLTLSLHLQRDTVVALPLTAISNTINQITVTAPGQQQLAPAGLLSIPVQRLQRVPTLLGEPDIMKALALTPGVTTGNEGTTGLLVRGGTQDQNLILLDEATVYNAAHLFGFVSIFNSDALKNVDMYKGGFPARFGGRLSSVLDITMKEGNNQELKGEASIGIISSRFNLEGPIGSERTSFMFSGRASYLSLLLLPRYFDFKRNSTASYYNYHLYDLNGKLNHQFKDGSHLFLSIYNGTDFWNAQEKNTDELTKLQLGWGNTTATARYSRVLNPKLFYRSVLTHSQYRYRLTGENKFQEDESNYITTTYATQSTVRDWTWRNGIDYFPGANHQVKFGSEITSHLFQPSAISTNSALDADTLQRANQQIGAWEYAVYAEDEALPLPWLKFNGGLRASAFRVEGRTYTSLEPRLSANFLLPHEFALKASYSQMRQYIHLLTSSGIGLPNDIWVPATRKVAPQFASQVTFGISKTLPKLKTELSLEAYHKTMTNLIDYRQGYNFLYSAYTNNWQNDIETQGKGEAYGLEFFANCTEGRFTGWLSYTLAWNKRRFSNINEGSWYVANFDRRHVASITGNYKLSTAWSLSSTWVYMTGQPATLPVGVQEDLNGNKVMIYTGRNNARMPAYHRLDLGASYTLTTRRNRTASWNFGVYNAYNRINPFYLDFKNTYTTTQDRMEFTGRRLVMRSLFPLLPSVSYTLRF